MDEIIRAERSSLTREPTHGIPNAECRGMKEEVYTARFSIGSRVILQGIDHPKARKQCTIIGILPNPSGAPRHQWYDVMFADGSIARFIERCLVPAPTPAVAP